MAIQFIKKVTSSSPHSLLSHRSKTTSSQYVASRFRDATFEKFMDHYKNLLKVISIQDLILANPSNNPPPVSVDFLNRLSQKLHLNRGATAFLRKYPRIFEVYYDPALSKPCCKLTPTAMQISKDESAAINDTHPLVIDRLTQLLSMSLSKTLPLRAFFKVWRELGLPDDFEDSILSQNPHLFNILDAHEPNTHLIKLVTTPSHEKLTAAVENWRITECCKDDCSVDRTEMRFSFKHGYPPSMKLKKNLRAKVKEWQKLPYTGPYEELTSVKKRSKTGVMEIEKRAVAIVHEFLSLTVEKTVEVEKISHFRKWFGIDLNVRDLFLDHPGMFYLSTKGKRHTVFLREGYERGCLIEPNPVYVVRRKLLDLVILGRRGLRSDDYKLSSSESEEDDDDLQETENDQGESHNYRTHLLVGR
ncbi:putative plant organelle RNA recognition domain-containing protein [Helianthus annuus]|nr:putative plant organelle RNA recognition domain-containing protein [Helianthus annuus]